MGGSDEPGLVHRSAPVLSGLGGGITLIHKNEGVAKRGPVKDKNSEGKQKHIRKGGAWVQSGVIPLCRDG